MGPPVTKKLFDIVYLLAKGKSAYSNGVSGYLSCIPGQAPWLGVPHTKDSMFYACKGGEQHFVLNFCLFFLREREGEHEVGWEERRARAG